MIYLAFRTYGMLIAWNLMFCASHMTLRDLTCGHKITPHGNSKSKSQVEQGTLRWLHNGHDGVSNHQPHHCLLYCLFGCRSKKTLKLRITGLCAGNSPGTGEFPTQMASNAEKVIMIYTKPAYSPIYGRVRFVVIGSSVLKWQFQSMISLKYVSVSMAFKSWPGYR